MIIFKKLFLGTTILACLTQSANAETVISDEGQYIFNTLGFYLGGVLVAFMLQDFVCLKVVW